MSKYGLPVPAAHRPAVSINTGFGTLPHLQLLPRAARLHKRRLWTSNPFFVSSHMALLMSVKAAEEALPFKLGKMSSLDLNIL